MHSFRPKFLRFSLRSLLLLITCLSAWFAWQAHQERRLARAIAAIESLSGQVRTTSSPPTLFGAHYHATEVHFLGPKVGDSALQSLASHLLDLSDLKAVTFVETAVTDEGAARIRQHLPGVQVKIVRPVMAPRLDRSR
jgi:hypothetical protein